MSLYSALSAGVTGLASQSTKMAAISDNITNTNTVGFKGTDVQFSAMVTLNGSTSTYAAGGVRANPQARISQQGLLQATQSETDLGIVGQGFFVVREGQNGDAMFTRAGSFKPDADGFLRNAAGLYLQGWKLDDNGNYLNSGSLASLSAIRVSDVTGTARPTTQIALRANLSAAAPVTAGYTTGSLAAGQTTGTPPLPMEPQFARLVEVFDQQGSRHQLTFGFVKTGPNSWAAEIYSLPASDVPDPNGLVATGTITFNPDGTLASSTLPSTLNVTWTNGAGSVPINLGLGTENLADGLTQYGSGSALISSSVDGGLVGNVAAIQIDRTGRVSAVFEDGTVRGVYQMPVATFPNPDGLLREDGNAFRPSSESGTFSLNAAGSGGAGTLRSSMLEASTVDLATEFAEMIKTQRAYSASSKIVTTVDEMLQEASNLKR